MRDVDVSLVEDQIAQAFQKIAVEYDPPILAGLKAGAARETTEKARTAMEMLLENAEIARKERIPICQDTGMAIVWIQAGQEVHFTGGSLIEAVNRGTSRGYTDGHLRASVVADPLFDRKNTKNNTPAVIYSSIVPGDQVVIEVMAKGFGSENKSKSAMLTPADGVEGVKEFVLHAIQEAGPNSCPPFIVGVGIGGTFDSSAYLAKRALLRPIDQSNPDPRYKALEDELLEAANQLHVGPAGLHGETTALKVQIEYYPTHIAGLPVAVNMCCHVCRHARMVI